MKIFKRFITWIREYQTEEARQTRLFNKEAIGSFPSAAQCDAKGISPLKAYADRLAELRKKFPKSKEAIQFKLDYDRSRPQSISPERHEELWRELWNY